jgi:predicted 3-demethylubiquinone-9 3-methyltransferase (glyoxalase superfamily)
MQKITTSIWFDGHVDEAIALYTSAFPHSRVVNVARYGDAGPGTKGDILTAIIELEGQEIMVLNGGPGFPHSPAMSLVINCESQAEVDHYWERLSEGGRKDQCGWVQDRFGVSWQVVPTALPRMLQDEDHERAARVMQAMLAMTKLDIAALESAYNSA